MALKTIILGLDHDRSIDFTISRVQMQKEIFK